MARELEVAFRVAETDAARILRFDVHHSAGRPTTFDVDVVLGEYLELEELIGKGAALLVGVLGEEPQRLSGIVESATVLGSHERGRNDRGAHYALHIASPLALLEGSIESRIFQEKSVQEIVTEVLADHGIDKLAWRLGTNYPKREYCVQYQESALALISRLCEEEGIYYFSEDGEEGETIVFADDSTVAPPIEGDSKLVHRKRTGLDDLGDAVYAIRERREVRSGKVTLRDYDFDRPELDLTRNCVAKERPDLEIYDYPGGFVEPAEGARLARVRLEAEQVARHTLEVDASCPRIRAGRKLALAEAGDLDGDYFVLASEQSYERSETGPSRYSAHARLLPLALPFRSPFLTPRPVVEGPQTATVTAPAGSPSETIHTDRVGRCKVRFRWDRGDSDEERSSCWMRVAQMQTSGSMMLARVGWEVLVEFLDGNPDKPIVTGLLYNAAMTPPYALPEGRSRTTLRTNTTPSGGGANEIRFEDKAGGEEIMIRAQRDLVMNVANDKKTTIGNNAAIVVGNDASLQVGTSKTTQITMGYQTTIGGDQSTTVGGNRKVEVNAVSSRKVGGDAKTVVGGNEFEMDGNPLETLLNLAAEKVAEKAQAAADRIKEHITEHVDGAINQALGPIQALQAHLTELGAGMQALQSGDLGAASAILAGAQGLPSPMQLATSVGGGPQSSQGSAPPNPLLAAAEGAASNPMRRAEGQGGASTPALGEAEGASGSGGGGQSGSNLAGPEANIAGVEKTDRAKGPGYLTSLVAGSYTESIGSARIIGAIETVDRNVGGDETLNVGAASVSLAMGNYAESVSGSRTETALGLIALTKAGESEKVGGSKTTMVGGAVLEKMGKGHKIEAGGPATFIGAFHKIEAQTSIVFQAGGSKVVIDGSGITIQAPVVMFLAAKIQATGKVSET